MCDESKRAAIHRPKTKFLDVEKAHMGYAKQRKHSKSQTRKLTRRLLSLLGKILKEIRRIEREHSNSNYLTDKEKKFIDNITKACRQQRNHFEIDDHGGVFGTQKEHYSLRRIKARRKETQLLYIFFGIHAANLVRMADRLPEKEQKKAA